MSGTVRLILLLCAMVFPALVLINQQLSLGGRVASLQIHERDSRVRRAVDDMVGEMLDRYAESNRAIYDQLIGPVGVQDVLRGVVPDAFNNLSGVRSEFGRPPMLFVALPVNGSFDLRYYALDESDSLLPFVEPTLEPIHRAVLTYVHDMIEQDAFRHRLQAESFHASSEHWSRNAVHFFHAPIYFDDPVIPRAYAGFWETVDFASRAFLLPFLETDALARKLMKEELDPEVFSLRVTSADETTLFQSLPAAGTEEILAIRLSAYGELFGGLTLHVGTVQSGIAPASAVRTQNFLLLGLAALWFAVAGLLLYRSTARDRWVAQMQRDFVGRISHELRTPVTAMLNAIQTIANPKLDNPADQERCRAILQTRIRELDMLLERMMAVCRLEGDSVTLLRQPLQLGRHLEEFLPVLCEAVSLPPERVRLEVSGDTSVSADVTAVDLIIRNLLDNVVKHAASPEEKPIELGCVETGRGIVISLRDYGVGIPKKEHKRVFRRFYRITEGMRVDTPGHGLGLALVKSLAEAHGGRVWVEGGLGAGSTFRVLLPKERGV